MPGKKVLYIMDSGQNIVISSKVLLCHQLLEVEENKKWINIFYLSEVFDKLGHGITWITYMFMESYITNRKQYLEKWNKVLLINDMQTWVTYIYTYTQIYKYTHTHIPSYIYSIHMYWGYAPKGVDIYYRMPPLYMNRLFINLKYIAH